MKAKPFTSEYVLAITKKQLLATCDKSIMNATARRAENLTELAEIDALLENLNTIKMAVVAVTQGDKQ